MSSFRVGTFDIERVPRPFRRFCPSRAVDAILDVDPAQLAQAGKMLVLLDVDNTLLAWKSEDIPESTFDWIRRAKAAGLKLCILSNTKRPERLKRIAGRLKIEYRRGRFKPSRDMYRKALAEFGATASEAVMIGDQMFTDVWGANRSGIESIWVRQMSPRDFVGTKISRMGERIVGRKLQGAIVDDGVPIEGEPIEDLAVGGGAALDLLAHPTVRQFLKFVIVGALSTIVDAGLHYYLLYVAPMGGDLLSKVFGNWLLSQWPAGFTGIATKEGVLMPVLAASPLFKVVSAGLAIFNSFLWNRRWTFKIKGKEHRAVQLGKFYTIAIVGLLLNTIIVTALSNLVPGHEKRSWAVATAIATVVVAFWNFFGQKLWTFRSKR